MAAVPEGPDRRRSPRPAGRVLAVPLTRVRAAVGPRGTLEAPGGPSVRLSARGAPSRTTRPVGPLPVVTWSEGWGRMRAELAAFASEDGAHLHAAVANPLREPRRLEVEAEFSSLPPRSRFEGGLIRGPGGRALARLAGGRVLSAARRRGEPGTVRVVLALAVPARGRLSVDAVLGPGGRTRPSASEMAMRAEHSRWEGLLARTGTAVLPEPMLQEAFARAVCSLVGSLAPGPKGKGLWPRSGLEPMVGPATDDALAVRALDLWGAGPLAERCLLTAIDRQGEAPLRTAGSLTRRASSPPPATTRSAGGSPPTAARSSGPRAGRASKPLRGT